MWRHVRWLWLAALLPVLGGCHGGEVRLRVSPMSRRHVWRAPLDPARFRADCVALQYALNPPVGYADARQRPLDPFILDARLRWNALVAQLCQELDRLCQLHNGADITLSEFNERKVLLTDLVRRLAEKQRRLDVAIERYRDEQLSWEKARAEGNPTLVEAAAVRLRRARSAVEDVLAEARSVLPPPSRS